MGWTKRLVGIPLALVAALAALASLAVFVLIGTSWGRDRIRDFVTARVLARLAGDVRFAAITGGGLFRGIELADVTILDPDSGLVLRADTVRLAYNWRDFLRGDVVFERAQLVRPVIVLEEGRDGSWNVVRAFGTGSAGGRPGGAGARTRIELRDVQLRDGTFTLRFPLDGETGFWRTERGPDGSWRGLHLSGFNATLPMLRLASREPGRPILVRVSGLAGDLQLQGDPVALRDAHLDLEIDADTIRLDISRLRLPGSDVVGRGRIIATESGPRYDFDVKGQPAAFADVRWLLPWLPREGGGTFDLHMATAPEGLAFTFRRLDARVGASRVTGRLGLVLPERGEIVYRRMDLRLDPLETRWIEAMTGDTLFFDGQLRGRFRGDGPLSQMTIETDLALEPVNAPAPSHVRASGILAWDGSFGGNPLHTALTGVEVDLVEALLGSDLPLRGRLTGTLSFTGTLKTGLRLHGELVHSDAPLPPSRFRGGGEVIGVEKPRVDMAFDADPLSLTAMAAYYTKLPFRGDVRGPVRLRGTLDDLDVDASVDTRRGRLGLRGRFDLSGEPKRYNADLEGDDVQVAAPRVASPPSELDFRAHVEGAGLEPEELELRGWVEVRASEFAGARIDGGFARLAAHDGVLLVDSAAMVSEVGALRLAGSFGLRGDRRGTLTFDLRADTLATWNRWLLPPDSLRPPETPGADGGLALLGAEPLATGARGPIRGSLAASGSISGNLQVLSLRASGRLEDVRWRDHVAAELAFTLSAEGPRDSLRIEGHFEGQEVKAFGFELTRVRIDADVAGDTARVEGELRKGPEARVAADLEIVRVPQGAELTLRAFQAMLRGGALGLAAPVRAVRRGRTLSVGPLRIIGPAGSVVAQVSIPDSGAVVGNVEVRGFDLADVVVMLPTWGDARGALQMDLRLAGSKTAPLVNVEVQIVDGALGGVPFSRLSGRGRYEAGALALDIFAWRGASRLLEISGSVPATLDLGALALRGTDRPAEVRVRADSFPLRFVLAKFEQFRDVEGVLRGEVVVRGTVKSPDLDGQLELRGGASRLHRVGASYSGIQGRVQFRGTAAELEGVEFRGPERGRGRAEGSLRLKPLNDPEFDLRFTASDLLAYNTRLARVVVTGVIGLRGSYTHPIVTGELTLESGALFVREVERQRQIIDLADPAFFNVVDTTLAEHRRLLPLVRDPFFQNMNAELTLRLTRDSWLRAPDRSIEIAGDLRLRWDRARQDLRISGTLEALRGEYRYVGKRFTVEGGTVEFPGTPGVNPDLNLVAQHKVQTPRRPLTIRIFVTGTLESPRIRLTSDAQPPIDEAGLLSYLLFGRPFSELTRGPGVVSAVGESVFGFAATQLESFVVSETGIVDYLDITGARGRGDPTYRTEENGFNPWTRVEAGWYLLPDVFVTVGQRFGGPQRSEIPDVRLDWLITRNLSLQFVAEERGARTGTIVLESAAPERTFGLFFFHEWSY